MISGQPLLLPELNWMLIGDRLAEGNMMYRDLWEQTAPFAAFVYQVIDQLFGRSQVAYQLLSILLVFFQAMIFNRLLLINKAFNEHTYVPALIYVICISSNTEFLTLSPQLLSMTFVLLAINNIFKRIDNFTKDELFLYTGLYLGIATLFHFPSIVFLLSTVVSLILFSNAIPRRLFLLVFGYVQLIAAVGLYYYWHDSLRDFIYLNFQSHFILPRIPYLSWSSLGYTLLVPGIFFVFSLVKLYSRNYYVNYQVKFQSVMLITFLMAGLSLFLIPRLSVFSLLYTIPVLAFFLSHLFLLIEKKLKAEILFMLFLILSLIFPTIAKREVKYVGKLVDSLALQVRPSSYENIVNGKKVLVLGDEMVHYRNASLATPYLNWHLSKVHLKNLEYYDILTEVFENFNSDLPDVIIDLTNSSGELLTKMPLISRHYSKTGNVYQRSQLAPGI